MKNLNEKVVTIKFETQRLEKLFAPEFLKQDLLKEKGQFSELINYRHSSNIQVVEDYISFASENNWCQEDLEAWNAEMSTNNPAFQEFVSLLRAEGYVNFDDVTLGTLWVIARIILSKDLIDLGKADDLSKVTKNTFEYDLETNELEGKKRERAIERKLNDGEPRPKQKRGSRRSNRHTAVQQWIKRLYPWLKTLPQIRNQKDNLLLIGLLFHYAGFEFYEQYKGYIPHEVKVDKEGNEVKVSDSFSKYLYNRMKAIYYSLGDNWEDKDQRL